MKPGVFDLKLMAGWLLVAAVMAVSILPTACSMTERVPGRGRDDERRATAEAASSPATVPAAVTPGVFRRLAGEPDIRVRILTGVAGVEVAAGGPAASPGELRLTPLARPANAVTLKSPLTITRGDAGWTVLDAARQPTLLLRGSTPAAADHLMIETAASPAGGSAGLRVNNRPYPGRLILLPQPKISPGVFDAIEHVPVESYLAGVVSRELYASWSLETFMAQAIAARSYALQQRETALAAGEPFDVESTEADQAYGGVTENPTALRAVRETAGMVLTWQGRILRAYYSSTCGGRASAARDIWPTRKGFEFNLAAPIQASGRDDSCGASPLFRWTVTRGRAELTRRLAWFGSQNNFAIRALKQLTKVEPNELNELGRPRSYRIFDADGKWYPLTAEQLRVACNMPVPASEAAAVPAGAATVGERSSAPGSKRDVPGPAASARAASSPSVRPGPAAGTPERSPAVAAPPEPLAAPSRDTRVSSGDVEFAFDGDRVTIRGRGFGHGCGMCQYGAEGMAKRGVTHAAMLAHFYPGAAIERAY